MNSDDTELPVAPSETSENVPPQVAPSTETTPQDVYDFLSEEESQEKEAADLSKSFLEGVIPELFVEREREFKDVEKHWVRTRGWLKVARQIAEETRKLYGRGFRYFTLPAYYRLDISLFLRENLLDVVDNFEDGSAKKVYVAAFENDPTKYGRMKGQSPEFTLFGTSDIEDALINPQNKFYAELLQLFPFDVINLDLTTSLTPRHEGPYSKTLRAINEVFVRQASHPAKWALFLTFRNMPVEFEERALDELCRNLQSNLDKYQQAQEAFQNAYSVARVEELRKDRPQICVSQAVAKWLVDRAHSNNTDLKSMECYYYTRRPTGNITPYYIYKQVLVFSRGEIAQSIMPTKGNPVLPWMIDDLTTCINDHQCVDVEGTISKEQEKKSSYRDSIQEDVNNLCNLVG